MSEAPHQPPAGPATVEREIAVEQAHVDRVYAHLATAHLTAEKVAKQANQHFQIDRADWAREEDGTALFERDAFTFQAAKRLAILDSEHDGLVFGRLDLTDGEARYIGRIGVRDDDYEPLVIDWRAPAAEPFYRATPAAPMSVTRRRVLRCRGERVVGIEDDLLDGSGDDTLVVVGEGALMAALARARGHQMRDIVATIQGEQDEAIRAPYQGVTIISGGPGTGKTVVALHRAAYLLYSNRRRFEHGGVLVVGPSGVFMNYIERVLPSLGEDSVTLRAVGAVAADVVGCETERIDDAATATVKGSLVMAKVIKRLVALPLADAAIELKVAVKGEILTLDARTLARIRKDVLASHRYHRADAAVTTALLNALWERLPDGIDVERAEFDAIVTDQAAWRMFRHAWWPTLTAERVLARLADPDVAARACEGLLEPDQIRLLVASYDRVSAAREWSVADMALLDEVFALLGPAVADEDDGYDPTEFLTDGAQVSELVTTTDRLSRSVEVDPDDEGHRTYAHVLVDEAQDITPMQWRMLRRRGPQASWTIVGDPAQSSWPNPAETQAAVDDLIGRAPHRTFRMSTNYRSPAEVFDLAGRVIQAAYPDADLPRAVRSVGVNPTFAASDDDTLPSTLVRAIRDQAVEVEGTIGVIAPVARLDSLEDVLSEAAATDEHLAAISQRIVLLSPLAAKGLEYDAAIVVAPDEIVAETSGGVRVLYVALTRPTQRLVTIDVNPERRLGAWLEPVGESQAG